MRLSTAALVAAGVSACLVLTACGGDGDDGTTADGLTKVTRIMATPSPIVSNSYFLEVPDRLGYFEEEGLDVTVEYANSANDAARLVLSDRGEFTQAGSTTFWSVGSQDPDLRVIGLTPHNGFFTVVADGSPVRSLEDLAGSTIGAANLNGPEQLFSEAALRSAGVGPQDITWVNVGSGAQAATALDNGDVDAYASYNGQFQVVGGFVDGGVRPLPSVLDDMRGFSGFMTTGSVLDADRDVAVRFMRAIYKGFVFTQANPEAAVAIFYEEHPDLRPNVASDEELFAQTLPIVSAGWASGGVPGEEDLFGNLTDEQVQESFDFLYENGLVEGERADLATLLALDVSRDANDFDRATIQEEAQTWFGSNG